MMMMMICIGDDDERALLVGGDDKIKINDVKLCILLLNVDGWIVNRIHSVCRVFS
jgi:hypothetical protein